MLNLAKGLETYDVRLSLGLFGKQGSLFGEAKGLRVLTDFGTDEGGSQNAEPFLGAEADYDEYARRVARLVERTQPDLVLTALPAASITWLTVLELGLCSPKPWVALDGHHPSRWLDEIPVEYQADTMTSLRRAYQAATCVIAASQGLRDQLINVYGLQREKVTHIYNPVDVDKIKTAEVGIWRGKSVNPVISTVGRLAPQKGMDVLLKAFAHLLARTDASLVIVGSGPSRAQLVDMVRSLGLENRVSLCGSHSEPWRIVKGSDVFVLASRWEGFGNVLVEAMATATPVVSCDCDFGPREILSDGGGVLVSPEDPHAIADAMRWLLAHPSSARAMALRGVEHSQRFSVNAALPKFADVLRKSAKSAN